MRRGSARAYLAFQGYEPKPRLLEPQSVEEPRPLKILILGASGFLGANLFRSLTGFADLEVIGLSRQSFMPEWKRLAGYSSESLSAVFDSLQPDVVINCVGIVGHHNVEGNPQLAHSINVSLPRVLGKLTHQRGIRIIHFSSDSVYSGIPQEAPFAESSAPNPFSLYGEQKLESEQVVQEMNPKALVMRVNFFGWSGSGETGILDHFVSHALAGTQPIGYIGYTVTSSSTSTVADAVMNAIDKGLSGVFNLASRDSMTKFAFGQAVFSLLGIDPGRVVPSKPSAWKKEGISERDLSMSSSLIEARLGISIPSQVEDMKRALTELPQFLDYFDAASRDPRRTLESALGQ